MKRFDHPPSPGGIPWGRTASASGPAKNLGAGAANASPTRRQRAAGAWLSEAITRPSSQNLTAGPIFGEILAMDPLIFNPAMDEYKQREDLLSICDS